jgi:hypothetical protein
MGISCLGGDDGQVLGEHGTQLLGSTGQLSARAAECKVLVVIETAALYDSLVCLQEIYIAQQEGIEIIMVRFERERPCVYKQWSRAFSDRMHREMVTKVRGILTTVKSIPESPGTMLDSQLELANVCRAVTTCLVEAKQIGLQKEECKSDSSEETIMDATAFTKSLPARWDYSSEAVSLNSSARNPQMPSSPLAINAVAASDTNSNLQKYHTAPATNATFSADQENGSFGVPRRKCVQLQKNPSSSSDKSQEARRLKKVRPLRRHDAHSVDDSAITTLDHSHMSSPGTVQTLKLPKTPQDGRTRKKPKKMLLGEPLSAVVFPAQVAIEV